MNYEIDATNKSFGRIASEVAIILQGKKNAKYMPRVEGDDSVVVKNIAQAKITGKKLIQKKYYRHTTQIGHLKEKSLKEVLEKKGAREVLCHAVMGMLPKNRLQIKRIKKLIIE